jgi:diamine N-acetyltransferase
MEIIRVSGDQLREIEDFANKIWPICYKDMISKQQIDYMLNKFYTLDALKNASKTQEFYVCKNVQKKTIAFFSFEHLDELEKTKLHKIYVDSSLNKKGIGTLILKFVEKQMKRAGFDVLFLNVNKYNPAVKFYEKQNFATVQEEVIDIGSGFVMDDFVMEKAL